MATNLHDHVLGLLAQGLNDNQVPSDQRLYSALRLLAKYRSQLLANTLIKTDGLEVQAGPFKGMTYVGQVAEGCYVPKLLGCYEQELHPILNRLPDMGLEAVINVGCAEGYYAIGLARMLPKAEIHAHDIDQKAVELCQKLAWENGVANRVTIGGEFTVDDFAAFKDKETLVVCDIEGGEEALLDPERAPALKTCHILVELHEVLDSGLPDRVLGAFEKTHKIERIGHTGRDMGPYTSLEKFEHLDQLLAVWEWRTGPTPWAFLTPKRRRAKKKAS